MNASLAQPIIKLPVGSFFESLPECKPDARTTAYIAGKAGSGKSVFAAGLLRRYAKLFPGNPIYGACKTKIADDPAFAGIPIKQLPLSFFGGGKEGTPFDLKAAFNTSGCMVLFDDWDSCDKGDKHNILKVIADIFNLGRKMKISCLVTSHMLNNYNETRGIIHEANFITIFPQNELWQSVAYLCSKLGVPKEVQADMRSMGRWVTIHNANPTYVLCESKAIMV